MQIHPHTKLSWLLFPDTRRLATFPLVLWIVHARGRYVRFGSCHWRPAAINAPLSPKWEKYPATGVFEATEHGLFWPQNVRLANFCIFLFGFVWIYRVAQTFTLGARGKNSIVILLITAFLKMFSEKLFHTNDNVLSFVSSFHARIRMFFVYERYKDRLQKSFIVVKCETLYTSFVRWFVEA